MVKNSESVYSAGTCNQISIETSYYPGKCAEAQKNAFSSV